MQISAAGNDVFVPRIDRTPVRTEPVAPARPATAITDVVSVTTDAPADNEPHEPKIKVKLKTKVKFHHHHRKHDHGHAHGHDHGKGHVKGKGHGHHHDPRLSAKLKVRVGDEKLYVKIKEKLDDDAAASIAGKLRDDVESFLDDVGDAVNGDAVRALLDEFDAAVSVSLATEDGAKTFDAAALATTLEEALAAFASGLESVLRGDAPVVEPTPVPPLLLYEPAPEGGVVIPEIGDEPVVRPESPLAATGVDVLA